MVYKKKECMVSNQTNKYMGCNPKISVIVPVYKVEQYLPHCIGSILAQNFTDFELMLIDDGSPDNSGKICDEYAKKDTRIRVFHKENGGVSSARNLGLDNAKGEWISFVDSDDWVEASYLRNYTNQIDEDSELVIQSYWMEIEAEGKSKKVELPTMSMMGNYRLVRWLEDTPNVHNGFLWHRLFKRSIIEQNKVRFAPDISFAEDGWFFFQYLKDAHHFKITSHSGYHYLIRKGSLTSIGKRIPLSVHEKVLRGFISSLYAMEVPAEHRAAHENFTRRYAWRLMESWLLRRISHEGDNGKKSMELVDRICRDYHMFDVYNVGMTLNCLKTICGMKNGRVKNLMLKTMLFIRKYEQKIKRHL